MGKSTISMGKSTISMADAFVELAAKDLPLPGSRATWDEEAAPGLASWSTMGHPETVGFHFPP